MTIRELAKKLGAPPHRVKYVVQEVLNLLPVRPDVKPAIYPATVLDVIRPVVERIGSKKKKKVS